MKALAPFAALALFAAGGVAAAEDFTFTVPITISELPPEITQMQVNCATTASAANGRRMIGSGSVTVAITDGAFSGDVVVAFDANSTAERHLAVAYVCGINAFIASDPGGVGGRAYYPAQSGTEGRFFPLAAGAPFVYSTGERPIP